MAVEDKEILLALGRLEGKVDALMTQQNNTRVDLEQHDSRLSILENSKSVLVGSCVIIAALISYAVTILAEA